MSKYNPPANFAYHNPNVIRAQLPASIAEIAFLHEKLGIRKYYLIDAPVTQILRSAGVARKLQFSQWSRSTFCVNMQLFHKLVNEIAAESAKGANVCILGDYVDVALVCAALRLHSGWLFVQAIKEMLDNNTHKSALSANLDALDAFDKYV